MSASWIWLVTNYELFAEYLAYAWNVFNSDELWETCISGSKEWFSTHDIDIDNEPFPRTNLKLKDVHQSIMNRSIFQTDGDEEEGQFGKESTVLSNMDDDDSSDHSETVKTIPNTKAILPTKRNKEAREKQMQKKKEAEAKRIQKEKDARAQAIKDLVKNYPFETVYKYDTFSETRQEEFDKNTYMLKVTDKHEDWRKDKIGRFPRQPKWYCPPEQIFLNQVTAERVDLVQFIPWDVIKFHDPKEKYVCDEPNNKDNRNAIAQFHSKFMIWLRERAALEKRIEQDFLRELHIVTARARRDLKKERRQLKRLLETTDQDDTRADSELRKFLKKEFPTRLYNEYTAEESLRLEAYKAQMKGDELPEYEKNKKLLEQVGMLQYFPAREEDIKDEEGKVVDTIKHMAYYKGRVRRYNAWITQNFKYTEWWAGQNFNPEFLAYVQDNKGKWIPIPPGDATDEKAPKYLRCKSVKLAYRQGVHNTCMVSSFACALHYISRKPLHDYIAEAARMLAEKALEFETKSYDECLTFICSVMKNKVPAIGQHALFNTHRKGRPVTHMLMDTLITGLTPYPTIVVPIGIDGSISHVVTVVDDLIFDSTQKYALKLCQQSLDWICGSPGCSSIGKAARFSKYIGKKNEFKFGRTPLTNWEVEQDLISERRNDKDAGV